MSLDGWPVTLGHIDAKGEIVTDGAVDPMVVEFVHAFPHRVEAWASSEGGEPNRLVAEGYISDAGAFVEYVDAVPDRRDKAGVIVLIIVDLLGVDDKALS